MLNKSKILILSGLFILFPLFFLPITQEFFAINKFLLTFLIVFALLILSLIQLVVERKVIIKYTKTDASVLFLVLAVALSTVFSSPNKISASFNVPFGFASIATFYVLYLLLKSLPQERWTTFKPFTLLSIGAMFSAFISLIFFTNPFASYPLPAFLSFLKTPTFNTVGSTLDLLLFSGFFVFWGIGSLLTKGKRDLFLLSAGAICTVVILLNGFYLIKNNQLRVPPVSQSWVAAVETLKNPRTALFGVGVGNFASQFTKVKTLSYNNGDLWSTNFSLSRSTLLHIWTETGILGLIALIALIAAIARLLMGLFAQKNPQAFVFTFGGIYLLLVLLLFPPSLPVIFLVFVYTGLLCAATESKQFTINLQKNIGLYVGVIFALAVLLPSSAYAVFRTYSAEFHFKQSLDSLSTGQVLPIYQNLQSAILLNPYEEKYRLTFSQLNLLIANNIALQKKDTLTAQDRQNITQAIQDSIREAKAAVALNPDKAANWENLAVIYQNLLNVASGADAWAISAYQKAILQDPVNPQLRLSLGGVYYSLKQFPNAATLFSQAVSLKPDWPNARYNLAWAFFQNKEYDKAILVMQNVLTLVTRNSPDYQKAARDVKTFQEAQKSSSQKQQPVGEGLKPSPTPSQEATSEAKLGLPKNPEAVVSPKIELPKEASPEAR